jgi:hypothetical protein
MKIERIDIHIDIIDNLGDMGWIGEFLAMNPLNTPYRIITDEKERLEAFLRKISFWKTKYEIIEKNRYNYTSASKIILLALHAKIDFTMIPQGTHVMRVSYLTFDPWYKNSHNSEYILSTPERPIREIIYSPEEWTGWVWHYPKTWIERTWLLKKINLSQKEKEKIWIPLFCYKETLQSCDWGSLPPQALLFLIGDIPTNILERIPKEKRQNIIHLPWLDRQDFWELIDLSDISLLRWEISSLRWLMSGKPYVWDMYKWLGGWNEADSEGFLQYIKAGAKYREFHQSLNSGKMWNIEDLISLGKKWIPINTKKIPDFSETLEKTIDSFGFSL